MMTTDQVQADVELRFSILRGNARFEWHNLLRYTREQTIYDPVVTDRYFTALTLFRQFLGESFLKQVGYTHPLATMILDAGPWQIQRLNDYVGLLSYLSVTDPDFDHFLLKLLSPEDAQKEAMHFLHIGHLLRSAGLDVRFPNEINGKKNPDVVITDPATGQVMYGEVSRVGKSKNIEESESNYYNLRRVMAGHKTNPLFSAIQRKPMSDDYLASLGPLLAVLEQHVAATNMPAEFTDDHFTIKQFPLSQQDELYVWMDTADRRKDLIGPPLSFDETRRISSNKIARKSKQLPVGATGVLFIPVLSLHFWQQRVTETVADFQRRLQDLPQVFGVYVFSEANHVDAENFRFNPDDGFDRTVIAESLVRYSLFVPNPAFTGQIGATTYTKFFSVLAPKTTKPKKTKHE